MKKEDEKIVLAKSYQKMLQSKAWEHLTLMANQQIEQVMRASVDPGFSGSYDGSRFISVTETYLTKSAEARGMKRLLEYPDLFIKQAESLSKKLNTKDAI